MRTSFILSRLFVYRIQSISVNKILELNIAGRFISKGNIVISVGNGNEIKCASINKSTILVKKNACPKKTGLLTIALRSYY